MVKFGSAVDNYKSVSRSKVKNWHRCTSDCENDGILDGQPVVEHSAHVFSLVFNLDLGDGEHSVVVGDDCISGQIGALSGPVV
jgi:hypothetical protein